MEKGASKDLNELDLGAWEEGAALTEMDGAIWGPRIQS